MQASNSRSKRSQVVLLLLYCSGVNKSETVYVSQQLLDEFGISRQAYNRVLNQLEEEQLVELIKGEGRKTKVKLLAPMVVA
jgi:DNA-binding IscR family transcriptional regulator